MTPTEDTVGGPRLTFEVAASPLHPADEVAEIVRPIGELLSRLGGREQSGDSDVPHCYIVATGGTEQRLLDGIEERRAYVAREPVLLVAHAAHNSLPAALETLARLHQDGRRGRIVLADATGAETTMAEAVADVDAYNRLQRTRIGLVGEPSPWLVASTPSAESVRERWGPTLVPIDIGSVVERSRATPVTLGRRVADRFDARPSASLPPPESVVAAAQLHPVLQQVAEEHEVDSITVRCFDLLEPLHTSGCVALAQFNDDGFVAGCEGDVPSTLALLWARHLLGQAGWIANPATLDTDANVVELAHCTVAPSLVESVSLSTHFESGIGVGLHGHFAAGPVTLIRIGGRNLDEVWLADGHIRASTSRGDRCRTQAVVELQDRHVSELLTRPLGNHVVLVAGHHATRLHTWWSGHIA